MAISLRPVLSMIFSETGIHFFGSCSSRFDLAILISGLPQPRAANYNQSRAADLMLAARHRSFTA
jgi:hypothetical protein